MASSIPNNVMKTKNPPEEFIHAETGEVYNLVPPTTSHFTDVNFHKIFLSRFQKSLEPLGCKQLNVVLWLMANMTAGNEIKHSYKEIAYKSKVSIPTVTRTIESPKKGDFLRRHGKVLLVNPDIIFKGRYNTREVVRDIYKKQKKADKVNAEKKAEEEGMTKKNSEEAQIRQLREQISKLSAELASLEKEINEKEDGLEAEDMEN